MNLDRIDAIFERVVLSDDLVRQLALLANGHEAAAEHVRHRTAQNEASRFDAGDVVDIALEEGPGQLIDGGTEGVEIGEEGGDVAKENALLRVIRDRPDVALDVET